MFQSFPTSFTYIDGSILVLRESGARESQVEAGEIVASLTGSGCAILGVRSVEGEIHVDCLQGGCAYEMEMGDILPFQAGQGLSLMGAQGDAVALKDLPAESIAIWDELCADCLASQ